MKTGHKPHDYKRAVRIAEVLAIDEIRTLLEIWYDEWHLRRWKSRREGEHTVHRTVAQAHRRRLCARLELPKSVKDVFRKPRDEDDWDRIELFRSALLRSSRARAGYSSRRRRQRRWR